MLKFESRLSTSPIVNFRNFLDYIFMFDIGSYIFGFFILFVMFSLTHILLNVHVFVCTLICQLDFWQLNISGVFLNY